MKLKKYRLEVITTTYKPVFELKAKDMQDAMRKSARMLNFSTQKEITLKLKEMTEGK